MEKHKEGTSIDFQLPPIPITSSDPLSIQISLRGTLLPLSPTSSPTHSSITGTGPFPMVTKHAIECSGAANSLRHPSSDNPRHCHEVLGWEPALR